MSVKVHGISPLIRIAETPGRPAAVTYAAAVALPFRWAAVAFEVAGVRSPGRPVCSVLARIEGTDPSVAVCSQPSALP